MTEWRVPTKDYGAQNAELLPELLEELRRVLLDEDPILGESVAEFEREFAAYVGTAHAVGVNSGTDALYLALRARGIGPGAEVITAANTFIATVSAILMAGARPVLVDPDPSTLVLSAGGVERAVTARTRAIMAVHLYGRCAPMSELGELADRHGLDLLEDAAQAHGAADAQGKRAGAHGFAGCFSFFPSKNLGAFGDAGMVTTGDAALAERLRVLRHLGMIDKHAVRCVAPNTKLDTLQAAILRVKLRRLDRWNARRRSLAQLYLEQLDGAGDLVLPEDPGGAQHVWHLFVARTQRRDALREHLAAAGIKTGVHYPIPPHLQQLDMDLGYRPGDFPVTEAAARTIVSLPLSHEHRDEQVLEVCRQVRRFYG